MKPLKIGDFQGYVNLPECNSSYRLMKEIYVHVHICTIEKQAIIPLGQRNTLDLAIEKCCVNDWDAGFSVHYQEIHEATTK